MPDKNMFDEAFPQDTQVGGSHYQHFIIQPWTFIRKNGLNPFQANVIKLMGHCFLLLKLVSSITFIVLIGNPRKNI